MDESISPSQRRIGQPGTILLFVLIESQATQLTASAIGDVLGEVAYKECIQETPVVIPLVDQCAAAGIPSSYTTYMRAAVILGLLAATLYGRLMDRNGRKTAMITGGLVNACADLWLYACASLPLITRSTIYPVLLSVILHGLAGAHILWLTTSASYIALTSSPKNRSTFFSLLFPVHAFGSAIGGAYCGFLAAFRLAAHAPLASFVIRVFHIFAVTRILHDAAPEPSSESGGPWTMPKVLRLFVDPVVVLFRDTTTTALTVAFSLVTAASHAFGLVGFLKVSPSIDPNSLWHLFLTMGATPFARFGIQICATPLFVCMYTHHMKTVPPIYARVDTVPTELAELANLGHTSADITSRSVPSKEIPLNSPQVWRLETLVMRWCPLAGAIGVLFVLLSDALPFYLFGTALVALAFPATMSLAAMLSLQTPVSEISRALTGFALIDAAVGLVQRPIPGGLVFGKPVAEESFLLSVNSTLILSSVCMICGSGLSWFVRRKVKLS